eukprot:1323920-Ditylum_brightwellii.AAC.1
MGDTVYSGSGEIYPKPCDQGIKAKRILQHMGKKSVEASNQICKENAPFVWSGVILQKEGCTKVRA